MSQPTEPPIRTPGGLVTVGPIRASQQYGQLYYTPLTQVCNRLLQDEQVPLLPMMDKGLTIVAQQPAICFMLRATAKMYMPSLEPNINIEVPVINAIPSLQRSSVIGYERRDVPGATLPGQELPVYHHHVNESVFKLRAESPGSPGKIVTRAIGIVCQDGQGNYSMDNTDTVIRHIRMYPTSLGKTVMKHPKIILQ